MDVIPLCLSEEDVLLMGDDYLGRLASCSTKTAMVVVRRYLESSAKNEEVADMIKKAYAKKFAEEAYLRDERLKEEVNWISKFNLQGVTYELDENVLVRLRDGIKSILENPYAVPYVAPINRQLFSSLLLDLTAEEGDCKEVAKSLKKCAPLFMDPPSKTAEGTCLKGIWKRRGEYEVMLRGLDILISRKKSGLSPSSWRYI